MANQTFTNISGTDNNYYLSLTLSSTPNTEGNYSDVAYTLAIHHTVSGTGYMYTYNNCVTLTINGTSILNTTNYGSINLTGISTVTLANGSIQVPHDSDGTKTISVSATFRQPQNSVFTFSVSGMMALDTIARSSVPTLSASGTAMGSAVTVYTNRASSGFTHTVRYAFGTESGTIATGVGASTSWTIPLTLANQIPNSTSGSGTIYLDTYSGSTLIGTQSVAFTATVPSSVVPTLSFTVAEAASIPSGISGYIQGRSKLKVTSTGAGAYGASIKSYAVTVDGISYSGSSVITNTLSSSGTLTIKVTVTDSRGRTASVSKSITVVAYSAPKLTGVTAYRCASSSSATADDDGAYICVMPKGSVASLSNTNGKTCIVYYKKESATSYSSKTLAMSDYTLDTEYVIFAADAGSSYDVYVTLADSFSGSTATYHAPQVMSASAYIHIPRKRNGMGIGKRAEIAGLDVGWDTELRKSLTVHDITNLQKGFYIFSSDAGPGSAGYICIARITITGTYADSPIEFTVVRRQHKPSRITILFANSDTTDPTLNYFTYFSGSAAFGAVLVKAAAGTWDLYIQKSEKYDYVAITDIDIDLKYMQGRVVITYPGTFVASVSGTTITHSNSASYADYAATAGSATSATNATNATRATTAATAEALKKAIDVSIANLEVTDGVEIHHATPYIDFHFANSTADYTARIIEMTKGILTAFNSITNASDKRLKKDIHDIPDEYYQLVEKLYPKLYRFTKADTYLNAGFIAQDILKTERELNITKSVLVRGSGKRIPDPKDPEKTIIDYFSVDYQSYSALLGAYFVRKMQELTRRIEQIEEKLSCDVANGEE